MELNYLQIHEYQKNRYPYLMVDYITEVIPGKSAKGFKHLTANDWFFKCHFEGDPSMPGMLQVEAMVQTAALALLTLDGNKGQVCYLSKANNLRFIKKIVPADTLEMETEILSFKRGIASAVGKGYVKGELVVEAEFILAVPHILDQFMKR